MDDAGRRPREDAVVRPPSLWFSSWSVSLSSSLAAGPVGKRETQLHRVFLFSIRAVLLSFLVLFLYE
jgi:hypothetical protein